MTPSHRLQLREALPDSISQRSSESPDIPKLSHGVPGDIPCLDSESLLQGHSSVTIFHRGAVYRLQTTRQGKLILTK